MSAANVVLEHDRAHLFTDSAACDQFGRCQRLVSKVRVMPGGRCAIAIRGHIRALDAVAKILPTFGSTIDDIRSAALDGRLRRALRPWRQALRGRFALMLAYDVTVVGWGKTGPTAFMFWNHDRMRREDGATVPPPFTPYAIKRANVLPPVPLSRADVADPLRRMPEIVQRQREHREPSLLLPKGRRFIGGFIEHTEITVDGVTVRHAGGWDEPIGQPIGGGRDHVAALRYFAFIMVAIWFTIFLATIVFETASVLATG